MPTLYVAHTPELIALLIFAFVCALAPMFFLQKIIPSLIPQAHPKTRWMDGLRGVAAALVSLNHAPLVLINLVIVPKVFYFDLVDSSILSFFGAIGVQVFFCITGFLFAGKIFSKNPIDWTDFYAKRVRRIVPAFFLAGLIASIIGLWFSWPLVQKTSDIIPAIPAIFGFGLLPMPTINGFNFSRLLGVAWTLAIEWKFYFVLPIVYIAVCHDRKKSLSAIIAFAFIDLYLNDASAWAFFIPGALCALFSGKEFKHSTRIVAGLIALAIVIAMFYRIGAKANYGLEQWLTVSALFAALAISRPGILATRLFVALGTVSYSFYLLHAMTLFAVFAVIDRYIIGAGELTMVQFYLVAGGSLALASILSTASYLLVEKRFMQTSSPNQTKALHPTTVRAPV
ncbi:acyltransferase [Pseudomonas sp. 58 R 3]|uniref:acyltransferase family protein n=1 Tax=Pseudomonas sp. 58 R 3 TaxID=1844108 RepID=UPI000812B648|nr:acyltransferase [Pseudomonas sp. 58 R 3]CRM44834.1 Acyltransferase family protein [Pseudomonas sp. 58 R 3]